MSDETPPFIPLPTHPLFQDLTGRSFGRWTVVGLTGKDKHHHFMWWCKCSCGKERNVAGVSLKSGISTSCGCSLDISPEVQLEKRKAYQQQWFQQNKAKHAEQLRHRRKAQPPENIRRADRNRNYLRKYGLTIEQAEDMLRNQGGRCPICDKDIYFGVLGQNKAVIDHDHETGLVRAILCDPCNIAIGLLHDDPTLLDSAKAHLEKHCGLTK